MTATATDTANTNTNIKTKTNTTTTFMSKIRRVLRELQGGQDAMFRYDREFRA